MNKHRLSIKNSGRRSSENMAGACGQIDFLVLISFPPWSSEWDSQGSHLHPSAVSGVMCYFIRWILRAEAQQTSEGKPGPTCCTHTCRQEQSTSLHVWGGGCREGGRPLPSIQVCPLGSSHYTSLPQRKDEELWEFKPIISPAKKVILLICRGGSEKKM